MAYRLKRSDDSIEAAVRRIADEQMAAALADIADQDRDRSETVHRVRKRCKQLRALIRLVRPGFADYADVNARVRALAIPLAVNRDADVMIQTCDRLTEECSGIDRRGAAAIRRRLMLNRRALDTIVDIEARLAQLADDFAVLRDDAARWAISRDGFDAIGEGVRKGYAHARKAMAHAEAGDPEDFHEWRKSVKYHWYHARLLTPLWPAEMATHIEAADALGDVLGEHHDLAVLDRALAAHPDEFGGKTVAAPFRDVLAQRSAALEQRAVVSGHLLLSEKPRALVRRWEGYWHAWQKHGDMDERDVAA